MLEPLILDIHGQTVNNMGDPEWTDRQVRFDLGPDLSMTIVVDDRRVAAYSFPAPVVRAILRNVKVAEARCERPKRGTIGTVAEVRWDLSGDDDEMIDVGPQAYRIIEWLESHGVESA